MELSETLKEKIRNSFEQKYVGLVQYSDDEYSELLSYTGGYTRSYVNGIGSYLYGDDEVHFVTLIEIAKRWKNADADKKEEKEDDKGYWAFVNSSLRINSFEGSKLYNAFTELIVGVLQHKKLPIAERTKRYYATIMMHAFAPYKSLEAFFDFVYNIFKKDLDFNYTNPDKGICCLAAEGFCDVVRSLGEKNIDVSIGSGAYGIQIGLRCMALCQETHNDFIDLIDKSLTAINLLYHGNIIEDDTYFAVLIKAWWQTKTDKEFYSDLHRIGGTTTKQNIVPKFIRREEKVYLIIPRIRFASGENPNLWLSIYVNGDDRSSVSQKVFTQRGEITITSVQQEFELNNLLRNASAINFRIVITENGDEIYNKLIKREFILFGDENEAVGRALKTGNYFVYALTIDKMQTPGDLSTLSKNFYNFYATEGEVLCDEHKQIVFTEKNELSSPDKIQIVGDSGFCKWINRDVECKVFCERVLLFAPIDCINGLEIRVDGIRKLLSTLGYDKLEKDKAVFDITYMIPQRKACDLVVYSHFKEKELFHDQIVLVQKLKINFSQRFYYGNAERKVRVSVGEYYKNLSWEYGCDKTSCLLCQGRLEITIPQLKWRIDNKDWHYGPEEKTIWYKDYFSSGSVLEVNAPQTMGEIKLFCVTNRAVQEVPQDRLSRFEIGKVVYANEGSKSILFFFQLLANNNRLEMCEVTTVERFVSEPPFSTEENKLRFIGDELYIGSKKVYFEIAIKRIGKEEIVIKSTELHDGIIPQVDAGIYWIKVSVPTGGLFVRDENILWEGEFVVGDKEKLKLSNTILKINPLFGIGSDFWKRNLSGYYVSELVRTENSDTYVARLYYKTPNGEETDVCGYAECQITIISPIALKLLVKDSEGNYTKKLKCDNSRNLYEPQSSAVFSVTNYNFVEVENV